MRRTCLNTFFSIAVVVVVVVVVVVLGFLVVVFKCSNPPPHHRSTLILNEAYVPQHFLFNRTPVQRGRDKISGHMYPHKNVAHSWLENRDM